jgi:hypothetical protein
VSDEFVHAWLGGGDPRKSKYAARFAAYQHTCGAVESFSPDHIAEMSANGGGCDACEAGEEDFSGWQPLYRKADSFGGAS